MVKKLESILKAIEVEKDFARVHAYDGKKYFCKLVGEKEIEKEGYDETPVITDKRKSGLIKRELERLKRKGVSVDIIEEHYKCSSHSISRGKGPSVSIPYAKYKVEFYQIVEDFGED